MCPFINPVRGGRSESHDYIGTPTSNPEIEQRIVTSLARVMSSFVKVGELMTLTFL
jgi:hypothetical protein